MSGHNKAFLGEDYSKLETVRICICGAGALGSNLVEALVQEGYAHITVIDFDRIERHNAYTQVYGLRDNGGVKVNVLKAHLSRKLRVTINAVQKRLDAGNAKKLLRDHDLVIDTFDNWESRILVRDACTELDIPCVHGGMSEEGYSEIRWNEGYDAPEVQAIQEDLCEYPLAGPLVHVTAALLQAVVTHHVITGECLMRTFTLRDVTTWKY